MVKLSEMLCRYVKRHLSDAVLPDVLSAAERGDAKAMQIALLQQLQQALNKNLLIFYFFLHNDMDRLVEESSVSDSDISFLIIGMNYRQESFLGQLVKIAERDAAANLLLSGWLGLHKEIPAGFRQQAVFPREVQAVVNHPALHNTLLSRAKKFEMAPVVRLCPDLTDAEQQAKVISLAKEGHYGARLYLEDNEEILTAEGLKYLYPVEPKHEGNESHVLAVYCEEGNEAARDVLLALTHPSKKTLDCLYDLKAFPENKARLMALVAAENPAAQQCLYNQWHLLSDDEVQAHMQVDSRDAYLTLLSRSEELTGFDHSLKVLKKQLHPRIGAYADFLDGMFDDLLREKKVGELTGLLTRCATQKAKTYIELRLVRCVLSGKDADYALNELLVYYKKFSGLALAEHKRFLLSLVWLLCSRRDTSYALAAIKCLSELVPMTASIWAKAIGYVGQLGCHYKNNADVQFALGLLTVRLYRCLPNQLPARIYFEKAAWLGHGVAFRLLHPDPDVDKLYVLSCLGCQAALNQLVACAHSEEEAAKKSERLLALYDQRGYLTQERKALAIKAQKKPPAYGAVGYFPTRLDLPQDKAVATRERLRYALLDCGVSHASVACARGTLAYGMPESPAYRLMLEYMQCLIVNNRLDGAGDSGWLPLKNLLVKQIDLAGERYDDGKQLYQRLLRDNYVSMNAGWLNENSGHAVRLSFMLIDGVTYLAYSNRGGRRAQDLSGITWFRVTKPELLDSDEFIKKIQTATAKAEFVLATEPGGGGIGDALGLDLKDLAHMNKSPQKVDNCALAAAYDEVLVAMTFLVLQQQRTERPEPGKVLPWSQILQVTRELYPLYKRFKTLARVRSSRLAIEMLKDPLSLPALSMEARLQLAMKMNEHRYQKRLKNPRDGYGYDKLIVQPSMEYVMSNLLVAKMATLPIVASHSCGEDVPSASATEPLPPGLI